MWCVMVETLEFLAKLLNWHYRGYPQVINSFGNGEKCEDFDVPEGAKGPQITSRSLKPTPQTVSI